MRIPLPTLMLLGINVMLAALIGGRLLQGSQRQSLLDAEPTHAADSVPQFGVPELKADLESIQASAVFYASRNFYVPPAPVLSVQPPPDYRVTGSMSIPSKPLTVMLIHNQSGARASVGAGSDLEGWTVTRVSPQIVALQRDGRTAELGVGTTAGASGMTLVKNGAEAAHLATPASGGMVRVISGEGRSNGMPASQPARPPVSDSPRIYRPPSG